MRLTLPENSVALQPVAAGSVPFRIFPEWVFIYATGESLKASRTNRRGHVSPTYDAGVVAYLDAHAVEVVKEVQP